MKMIGVRVKYAWWYKYYMNMVAFFCILFDSEPNPDKLTYWTAKAMKFEVVVVDADEAPKEEKPE